MQAPFLSSVLMRSQLSSPEKHSMETGQSIEWKTILASSLRSLVQNISPWFVNRFLLASTRMSSVDGDPPVSMLSAVRPHVGPICRIALMHILKRKYFGFDVLHT